MLGPWFFGFGSKHEAKSSKNGHRSAQSWGRLSKNNSTRQLALSEGEQLEDHLRGNTASLFPGKCKVANLNLPTYRLGFEGTGTHDLVAFRRKIGDPGKS